MFLYFFNQHQSLVDKKYNIHYQQIILHTTVILQPQIQNSKKLQVSI